MNCRACGEELQQFFSLGDQYLSDFRDDRSKPPQYPLDVAACPACTLVQLVETVPRDLLYHDRYGFKSGVNGTVVADLASVVDSAFKVKPKARSWLDIASNDGTLLSFVPENVWREGVDPVRPLCVEAEAHADRISNDYFHPVLFDRKFDVVTAVSVFYDLDDPNQFLNQIKQVMARGAVLVVQQNYLLPTLQLGAVDNFCHEHVTYFSMLSLQRLLDRHDLEVFHVETSDVNGGVFRTLIGDKGARKVQKSVHETVKKELDFGLDRISVLESFALMAATNLSALKSAVMRLHDQGKIIYFYGASTRGSVLWQAAEIDHELVDFAVERNPNKVGKWFSPVGVKIISEDSAHLEPPDYMLVGPWFFRDEFIDREAEYLKQGGKFIFPLPKLEIVP